ncbi:MAG: carbon-nitrogen family hydrolase [bacterium]|nr:carbon-nitrogen family hydrolase [bacterium]
MTTRKLKLANIQFGVVPGKIDQNRSLAERLIRAAAGCGAKILCLPELFTTGHDFNLIRSTHDKEAKCSETLDWLGGLARSLNIYLAAGTLPEKEGEKFYNTTFFFSSEGELLGKYRKVHLFPQMGEDSFFTPGQGYPLFHTPLARIGIAVCYDLRFPGQFADLAAQGAEIILVPARFPHPRLDHWRILIRARAIENYLFVAGCNASGTFDHTLFCGHSCIISPWGETVAEAGEREDVLVAEIDLDLVEESRSFFRQPAGSKA